MKTTLRIAALALALSLAGAASAQQAAGPKQATVGIGVGLPTNEFTTLFALDAAGGAILPAQIYVPINVSPRFRIEPQVGIFTVKQDGGPETSVYSLGAGAFYLMPLGQSSQLYVGPRLALSWFRAEDNGGGGFTQKTKGTDVYLAATLGGEFMATARLGIGAEAQLGYFGIGDRKITTAGVTVEEPGGSSWQTQGILFVRLYLF